MYGVNWVKRIYKGVVMGYVRSCESLEREEDSRECETAEEEREEDGDERRPRIGLCNPAFIINEAQRLSVLVLEVVRLKLHHDGPLRVFQVHLGDVATDRS